MLKKLLTFMTACALALTMLSGCGRNSATIVNYGEGTDYNTTAMSAEDSSELPDWNGKTLEIKYWSAHGAGGHRIIKKSDGDVVSPEIKRVTGITIDEDNSFDNGGGQTFDVKLGFLSVSNDWPHIVTNATNINTLVDNDKIYDLTELVPKYCPNIMKKIPKSLKGVWNDVGINAGREGKIYAIPTGLREEGLPIVDSDLNMDTYSIFLSTQSSQNTIGFVWVRDDIVKKLYPSAKTQREIEELFLRNGEFTKEDLLDVPINSKEDFIKFLYDIKSLGVKENETEVFPIALYSGLDNWDVMYHLRSKLEGSKGSDYFTYYNKQTKKVEYAFDDPDFKEYLKLLSNLLRDGIGSMESLLDSRQIYEDKVKNGLYAVVNYDSENFMPINRTDIAYRKVYLNIPQNTEKYYQFARIPIAATQIAIFKNMVKEEDLPQILKWIDFMVSDVGEKLVTWGPKNADLWEEIDGKRVFKDKELEGYMVNNNMEYASKGLHYNLSNGFLVSSESGYLRFSYMRLNRSKFSPAVTYKRERSAVDVNNYFSISKLESSDLVEAYPVTVWTYANTLPNVDKAWKSRKLFEDTLLKVITAKDDESFEDLYKSFINTANQIGFNENLLEEVDAEFRRINTDYMQNLN